MAQLDLCHELCLDFVDAESDHQIGNHLGLLLGFPDDPYRLVNIQKNPFQPLQQMELVLLLLQVKISPAADAFDTESDPFTEKLPDSQYSGHSGDQHVKVAGEGILQRRHAEKLQHQLFRIHAPLQINGDFQAVQPGFIPDIRNLLQLALLYQFDDFLDDGLAGGRRRDAGHVYAVSGLVVGIPRPHLDAAAAGGVHLL